ncbi:MAG: ABC transporter ATP-binding protein [Rubrivivax sp.]|jgi:branched-chain amino acid transport system ATP-binding protein|nr:ABC transporter ATP-binding protein [Rubrivivax sp.]
MSEHDTSTMAPTLHAQALTASYGRIRVVHGVDLELRPRELLVLLGPNGAGKSSLLGAMAGIVRSGGQLSLLGRSLAGLAAERRAGLGMAFVPERRGNVFSAMSVAENLELGLRLAPRERREAIRAHILELFPILTQRLDSPAGMLSGGEQQMLAIGMALGREPKVLLLDEPSQGLAPVIYDLLEEAFRRLCREGLSLLVAEQNLPLAARIADRYVVLSHGSLVAAGDPHELHGVDDLMALYTQAEA